jgi:UDP-4-amino-4,6-dideoxy-N-acetyl-beta-L-altrosamine N-acetyltransferase
MSQKRSYTLREIQETDLGIMLEWRNSERIRAYMYTDHVITPQEHGQWFQKLQESQSEKCLMFLREYEPTGIVRITQIDSNSRKCYWGFYTGDVNAPKGSGLVMGYLALEYIFSKLAMRKVCGEAFAFNEASLGYHRKLGFVDEGRFVKHVLKKDQYEDIVCFALFENEWNKKRIELGPFLFPEESLG